MWQRSLVTNLLALLVIDQASAQFVGGAFYANRTAPMTPDAAAYSVRLVVSSYSGSPGLRVRRSNDNAEQDIGFVGGGGLDTSSLTTFCGVNSCFVKTWYDQSGNGRHAVQTTEGSQPRIVNAGTIDTKNSLPTLVFDGTADYLIWTGTSYNVHSVNVVAANVSSTASNYQGILGGALTEPTNGHLINIMTGGASNLLGLAVTAYPGSYANGASSPTGSTSPMDSLFTFTGIPSAAAARTEIWIGQISGGARYWSGVISEVRIFSVTLPTSSRTSLQSSQKTYFSTP